MIERRSILKGLVALVAAPAVVKVASLMSCAPTEIIGWGTNDLLTINQITRHAVEMFSNSDALLRHLERQYGADLAFAQGDADNGWQWPDTGPGGIGQVLRIRLPNDFVVSDGPCLYTQEPTEHWLTLDQSPPFDGLQLPPVVDVLAITAVTVAAVPKILKTPVTRRFWSLPQHSAANEEG